MPVEISLQIAKSNVKIMSGYVVIDDKIITFVEPAKPIGAKACYEKVVLLSLRNSIPVSGEKSRLYRWKGKR